MKRVDLVEDRLGQELLALIKNNAAVINYLCELLSDNIREDELVDFALNLFLSVGSTGPSNPPFFEQKLSANWEHGTLIFQVPDSSKGRYIGKGGCHIKNVQRILGTFGYDIKIN